MIDEQHQKLVAMVAQLQSAFSTSGTHEALGVILDQLIEYVLVHFSDEERVMANAGFPDLPEHRSEHDAFARKAVELGHAYQNGKAEIGLEVLLFLQDWLVGHILGSDKYFWKTVDADPALTAKKLSGALYQ